jgi:hypothetical protein
LLVFVPVICVVKTKGIKGHFKVIMWKKVTVHYIGLLSNSEVAIKVCYAPKNKCATTKFSGKRAIVFK